jgi:hypothetical protein
MEETEHSIEFFFELLLQLVLEILGEILIEIVAGLGWESVKHSLRGHRKSTPFLAGFGHLLMGLIAGVVSLILFGHRLTPASGLPGLSLVAAPIGTGLAMHRLGEFWEQRGQDRPVLFTFRAGAIFAFGMALVRFVHLELQ